jgi:hypothetical protein
MHTVDLLEEALRAASVLGYRVRQEWLGGSGGGSCEIKGRLHLFIDLANSVPEQLDQALDSLRRDPRACQLALSQALRNRLDAGLNTSRPVESEQQRRRSA